MFLLQLLENLSCIFLVLKLRGFFRINNRLVNYRLVNGWWRSFTRPDNELWIVEVLIFRLNSAFCWLRNLDDFGYPLDFMGLRLLNVQWATILLARNFGARNQRMRVLNFSHQPLLVVSVD
jgi:hypothetical protein